MLGSQSSRFQTLLQPLLILPQVDVDDAQLVMEFPVLGDSCGYPIARRRSLCTPRQWPCSSKQSICGRSYSETRSTKRKACFAYSRLLAMSPAILERDAKVVVSRREIRIDCDGALKRRNGGYRYGSSPSRHDPRCSSEELPAKKWWPPPSGRFSFWIELSDSPSLRAHAPPRLFPMHSTRALYLRLGSAGGRALRHPDN